MRTVPGEHQAEILRQCFRNYSDELRNNWVPRRVVWTLKYLNFEITKLICLTGSLQMPSLPILELTTAVPVLDHTIGVVLHIWCALLLTMTYTAHAVAANAALTSLWHQWCQWNNHYWVMPSSYNRSIMHLSPSSVLKFSRWQMQYHLTLFFSVSNSWHKCSSKDSRQCRLDADMRAPAVCLLLVIPATCMWHLLL